MENADRNEPPGIKADVIVVADRITPSILSCVRRALDCSGPILNKLIVITGCCRDPDLERLLLRDPRVTLSPLTDHLDDVRGQ